MGSNVYSPNPVIKSVTGVVDKAHGGTGVTSKEKFAKDLGIIDTSLLNKDSGVATLGSDGKVLPSQLPSFYVIGPTLDGPDNISVGQTVDFTITNYDVATVYTVTVSAGTVSTNGKTITFVAPAVAQVITMVVNGRSVTFPVKSTGVSKPSIVNPAAAASIPVGGYTFTSSAFGGTLASHVDSDWQVASDVTFLSIRYENPKSSSKTSWTLNSLAGLTTGYVRVRYRASDGSVSDWSDGRQFTVT